MGMYDILIIKCPECGAKIEFQSKAGERLMMSYNIKNVPKCIAGDLDGQEDICPYCSRKVKIKVNVEITVE